MKRTISILFLFLGITLFSQQTTAQKDLLKKANENIERININPEKAFQEAKKIEKEAQKINAEEAELIAIEVQCSYYKIKNDFKNLLVKARMFSEKAKTYNTVAHQVIASRFLFEAYILSNLPDKAFQELEQAIHLANNLKEKDSLTIQAKADLFISYANYYMLKDDYQNQLRYIKLSGEEFEKLPKGKYQQRLLYVHYSNIASVYNDLGQTDSAKFYAILSQSKGGEYERNDVSSANLTNLGKAAMKEENYKEALSYFKKAEKLEGNKVYIATKNLYDYIIESYRMLKQEDSLKIYQAKKDSLKIDVTENQNKLLHNLLEEKKASNPVFIYIISIFLLIMTLISIWLIRKNRILVKQEQISQQYLERNAKNPSGEHYSKLLELLKKNDPAFMNYFNETFPDFSSKLKEINPKISTSDIEFSAFLKLKIPTKEIARLKFVTPKTVLNKKYIIKNKLNIPKEKDIYEWFEEI